MALLNELWDDIKALGGLPLFGMVSLLALALGHVLLFAQLVVGVGFVYAIVAVIRSLWFVQRPKPRASGTWLERMDASSFPSIHTTRATLLGGLLMLFLRNNNASILLALGVLAVAVIKVKIKHHYVRDVIGGLVLGSLLVLALHFYLPLVVPLP